MITTTDEGAGPRLNLSDETVGDEEGGEPRDDNGSIDALAKEFKAQLWDPTNQCGSEPSRTVRASSGVNRLARSQWKPTLAVKDD